MAGTTRREFSDLQKRGALNASASYVARRWPELAHPPHYMCESCGYVSASREDFEIDHTLPAARGGGNDRYDPSVVAALSGSFPDPALLNAVGLQAQVLCRECNRAKGSSEFVPRGRGYAFSRSSFDQNPEHRYHGWPTTPR